MFVIKCVKPGKSYGINVKEGKFLADPRVDYDFTQNINKAHIFLSQQDARFHIRSFLSDKEYDTALFIACEVELKIKV